MSEYAHGGLVGSAGGVTDFQVHSWGHYDEDRGVIIEYQDGDVFQPGEHLYVKMRTSSGLITPWERVLRPYEVHQTYSAHT